LRLLPLAD